MPDITLVSVRELPDDILEVVGELAGSPISARGWASSLTNHYDADSIDTKTGQRSDKAQPRAMTMDEAKAYCVGLLHDAAGLAQPVVVKDHAELVDAAAAEAAVERIKEKTGLDLEVKVVQE